MVLFPFFAAVTNAPLFFTRERQVFLFHSYLQLERSNDNGVVVFLHNSLAFSMVIRRFYNKLAMIKLIFLSHVTLFSLIVTFVVCDNVFKTKSINGIPLFNL